MSCGDGLEVELCQRLPRLDARLSQRATKPGLAAPLQFVVEQQRQELGWAELRLGRLRRTVLQSQQHAREPELPQFGQERMVQHDRASFCPARPKKSSEPRAKANVVWTGRTGVSGSGCWSSAALRTCLMRR